MSSKTWKTTLTVKDGLSREATCETVSIGVPIPRGVVTSERRMELIDDRGKSVALQTRRLADWEDGSARWVLATFQAGVAAGGERRYTVRLRRAGRRPRPLRSHVRIEESPSAITASNGVLEWRISKRRFDLLGGVRLLDGKGHSTPLTDRKTSDVAVTDHRGRQFRASNAADGYKVTVVERGPVRFLARLQGKHRNSAGRSLLDFDILASMTAGNPAIEVSYTFINREARPFKFVRDISMTLGVKTRGNPSAMFHCGVGVFQHKFTRDHELFQTQKDQHFFETYQGPKGGPHIEINSGGCSGERAEGWAGLSGAQGAVTFAARNYWQQWPKSIRLDRNGLSFAVWPEEANEYIAASKRILPPMETDDPWRKHDKNGYKALTLHPYVSGFSRERKCLDLVQGVAKTHEMMFCFDRDEGFNLEACRRFQNPLRVTLDPGAVRDSGAIGDFGVRRPGRFPRVEKMLDRAMAWMRGHAEGFDCCGMMDHGDFRYLALLPETEMMKNYYRQGISNHPRISYWNNNEDDLIRACIMHYLRAEDADAFRMAGEMAQHLCDVDVRHCAEKHPLYTTGLVAHAAGHCFRGGSTNAPDHAWFHGVYWYYFLTGRPFIGDTLELLKSSLLSRKDDVKFGGTNLRSTSLFINNMNFLYTENRDPVYLQSAREVVHDLISHQHEEGYWTNVGPHADVPDPAARKAPAHDLFMMHACEAVGNYALLTGDEAAKEAFLKCVSWVIRNRLAFGGGGFDLLGRGYHPNSSLQMVYVLGNACKLDAANRKRYQKVGRDFIAYAFKHQIKNTPRRGGGGWFQMNSMEIRPLGPPDAVYYVPYFLRTLDI